jgi:hypothetical protein
MGNPLQPVAEELFLAFSKAFARHMPALKAAIKHWDELDEEVKMIWLDTAREAVEMSDAMVHIKKVLK